MLNKLFRLVSSHVLTPVSRQCLKSRTFSLCLSLVSSRLDQIRNVSARLTSRYLCLGQCRCLTGNVLTPSLTKSKVTTDLEHGCQFCPQGLQQAGIKVKLLRKIFVVYRT